MIHTVFTVCIYISLYEPVVLKALIGKVKKKIRVSTVISYYWYYYLLIIIIAFREKEIVLNMYEYCKAFNIYLFLIISYVMRSYTFPLCRTFLVHWHIVKLRCTCEMHRSILVRLKNKDMILCSVSIRGDLLQLPDFCQLLIISRVASLLHLCFVITANKIWKQFTVQMFFRYS